MVLFVQRLTDQEGELVGVLTHGRHTNRARPVVVHVTQLVAHSLIVIGLEASVVVDHVVVSRIDCALGHVLRDQIEIEPFFACDHTVYDCAARRIAQRSLGTLVEEARVASLLDNNETERWLIGRIDQLECLLNLRYLVL